MLRRLICVFIASVAGAALSTAALGADTDVFFPTDDIGSEGVARPNILFLMDTSGSMAGTDGTDRTRLRRVQDALHVVLDDLGQNVNVGLGRLSGTNGGAILFPVSPIDALVTDVDPSATHLRLVDVTDGGANEAQQIDDTLTTAPQYLEVGQLSAGSSQSSMFYIDDVVNEAEQYQDGKVDTKGSKDANNRYSGDLELYTSTSMVDDTSGYSNGYSRYSGLRYALDIPAGATITNAYLKFTCSATSSSTVLPLTVSLSAEAADSTLAFQATNNNISSRTLTSALPVSWVIASRCNANTVMDTPNLSSLVQAVVNRSGWAPGNAMTFVMQGAGQSRTFYARQGNNRDRAPRLVVEYTNGMAEHRDIGLRFSSVDIPRGVTVTSAKLLLRSRYDTDPVRNSSAATIAISSEASSNPVPFSTSASVTSRSLASSELWAVPSLTTNGTIIESPDISSVIQAVVNRSDWCGGLPMVLTLTPSTGEGLRGFYGFAANSDYAPVLSLQYSVTDPELNTGCAISNRVNQITSGADDAEEFTASGSVSLNGDDLELGYDGTGASKRQLIGLRFPQLDIPAGSTIRSAKITFKNKSTNTTAALSLRIVGHNVDNSSPFEASAYQLSNRLSSNPTSATVAWSAASWPSQTFYDSPDLSAIVQEVIGRSGWAAGNALTFLIEPTTTANFRRAYSRDGQASGAPKLTIEFESPLGQITVRRYLQQLVEDFSAEGNTPLPEMLYEAARYYRGEAAFFGRTRGAGATTDATDGYNQGANSAYRISHRATFVGTPTVVVPTGCSDLNPNAPECANERVDGSPVYASPISEDQECTASNIVMLSDGEPNENQNASVDKIKAMTGGECAYVAGENAQASGDASPAGGGTCGAELAGYLHDQDQSAAVSGDQPIDTYTIGFADAGTSSYLQSIATAGGGQFFPATSTAEVVAAFQEIIRSILDVNTSFVAPAVTVNSFNRLSHRDELYFAIFQPTVNARWPGNLKRYRLSGDTYEILDANDQVAVDDTTGFFKTTATSYWTSGGADGADVTRGGAASELTNSRKVMTYTGGEPGAGGATLTQSLYGLCTALSSGTCTLNASITNAMLGLGSTSTDDAERDSILHWAAGLDELDEDSDSDRRDARLALGDPLHSRPQLLVYGGSDDSPDIEIYVGDNEGFLHAFRGADGSERFAFIPPELLPNLKTFYRNEGGYASRPQGLDGPVSAWHADADGDLVVDSGESAYLYVGMRRGGRSYYALDVSDRDAPKYLYRIVGGSGDYAELGQTWSTALPAHIMLNGVRKSVLIFGGGYDPDQESSANTIPDDEGRALFIADAATGQLIWWTGYDDATKSGSPNVVMSSMQYSVPATPKAVDLDGDGNVDRIYFADLSGQVFRVILDQTATTASDLALRVDRIAVLSAPGGSVSDDRRFYNTPDVALIQPEAASSYLTIALGSGFREKPLSTNIADRFYVLRDPDTTAQPTTVTLSDTDAIAESDLFDVTDNVIGEGSESEQATAQASLAASDGFYLDMGSGGEKVITDAQTFDNQVMFSSYEPDASSSRCQATPGVSRFYLMSILDGTPSNQTTTSGFGEACTSGTCDSDDRSIDLKQSGLPPNPVVLFPEPEAGGAPQEAVVCVGAECFSPGFEIETQKAYWTRRR